MILKTDNQDSFKMMENEENYENIPEISDDENLEDVFLNCSFFHVVDYSEIIGII